MALIIKNEELQEVQLSEEELRLELAVLFYQQKRLSLGKASKFAGLNRILFQKELGKRQVETSYDQEELSYDLKALGMHADC